MPARALFPRPARREAPSPLGVGAVRAPGRTRGRTLGALLVAMALLPAPFLSAPVFAQDAPAPGRLSVSGEGRVAAAPDMATVSLAVSRETETASEALRATSEAMAEVLAALREAGLEERDVQTTDVSLSPVYERDSSIRPERERPTIVGYAARNGISVRVRDLDLLGEVLDRTVDLGVNEGGGLVFGNSEVDALQSEARALAVGDAVARAEAMAAAAGVELGRLVSLQEGGGFVPPPRPFETRMAAAEAVAVPIAAGESETVARVNAVFEIGPPSGDAGGDDAGDDGADGNGGERGPGGEEPDAPAE